MIDGTTAETADEANANPKYRLMTHENATSWNKENGCEAQKRQVREKH